MDERKAKYFCEGCGSEVAPNAKICPKCGRFFAAVRCPKCGHVGTVRNFINGCPSCHYAISREEIFGTTESGTLDGRVHGLSSKSKRSIKKAFKKHEQISLFSDTPAWLFFSSIIALLFFFAMFFFRCKN